MKRLISIIAAFTFLANSIAWAGPAGSPQSVVHSPQSIYIPEQYGRVEHRAEYLSPAVRDHLSKSQQVILINDAHCVYEAQKNIEKMLDILIHDYKIDLVCVEGASGKVDTNELGSYKDKNAREKVADKYTKNGLFTAGEALSIKKGINPGFTIYGVEDAKLYWKDFQAFRDSVGVSSVSERFLNLTGDIISQLKKKLYSKDLFEFDSQAIKYENGEISLTEWVKYLSLKSPDEIASLTLAMAVIPMKDPDVSGASRSLQGNIGLVLRAIELEEKIDFRKVEEERADLVKKLEGGLVKEDLKELIKNSLLFKLGKMPAVEYYSWLEGVGKNIPDEIASLTRNDRQGEGDGVLGENLKNYIELVKIQAKVNEQELFNELDLLKEDIYRNLISDGVIEKLHQLDIDSNVLSKVLRLKANRKELLYYKDNIKKFNPDELLGFIKIQTHLNGIFLPNELNDPSFLEDIKNALRPSAEFYELALRRDESLVDNLIKRMSDAKKDKAILVCGGFHSEGIGKLLEDKGINLVTISPSITKVQEDSQKIYLSRMMDSRINPEKILSETGLGNLSPVIAGDLGLPEETRRALQQPSLEDMEKYGGKIGLDKKENVKDLSPELIESKQQEYIKTDDEMYAAFLLWVFNEWNRPVTDKRKMIDIEGLKKKRKDRAEFKEYYDRARRRNTELQICREIPDAKELRRIIKYLDVLLECLEEIPEGILFKAKEPLILVVGKIKNEGEADIRETNGKAKIAVTQLLKKKPLLPFIEKGLDTENFDKDEIRKTLIHELIGHKLGTVFNKKDRMIMPPKDWIDIARVNNIKGLLIYTDEEWKSIMEAIRKRWSVQLRRVPIEDLEKLSNNEKEFLEKIRNICNLGKIYYNCPHEIIAFTVSGDDLKEDNRNSDHNFRSTTEILKRNLLREEEPLSEFGGVKIYRGWYLYGKKWVPYYIKNIGSEMEQNWVEVDFLPVKYTPKIDKEKGRIPQIEKRFGRLTPLVEEAVFRWIPFWGMYFVSVLSPAVGITGLLLLSAFSGYLFIRFHKEKDRGIATGISIVNSAFLLAVFVSNLLSPIILGYLVASVISIPVLWHYYKNSGLNLRFTHWTRFLALFSMLVIVFILPKKFYPPEMGPAAVSEKVAVDSKAGVHLKEAEQIIDAVEMQKIPLKSLPVTSNGCKFNPKPEEIDRYMDTVVPIVKKYMKGLPYKRVRDKDPDAWKWDKDSGWDGYRPNTLKALYMAMVGAESGTSQFKKVVAGPKKGEEWKYIRVKDKDGKKVWLELVSSSKDEVGIAQIVPQIMQDDMIQILGTDIFRAVVNSMEEGGSGWTSTQVAEINIGLINDLVFGGKLPIEEWKSYVRKLHLSKKGSGYIKEKLSKKIRVEFKDFISGCKKDWKTNFGAGFWYFARNIVEGYFSDMHLKDPTYPWLTHALYNYAIHGIREIRERYPTGWVCRGYETKGIPQYIGNISRYFESFTGFSMEVFGPALRFTDEAASLNDFWEFIKISEGNNNIGAIPIWVIDSEVFNMKNQNIYSPEGRISRGIDSELNVRVELEKDDSLRSFDFREGINKKVEEAFSNAEEIFTGYGEYIIKAKKLFLEKKRVLFNLEALRSRGVNVSEKADEDFYCGGYSWSGKRGRREFQYAREILKEAGEYDRENKTNTLIEYLFHEALCHVLREDFGKSAHAFSRMIQMEVFKNNYDKKGSILGRIIRRNIIKKTIKNEIRKARDLERKGFDRKAIEAYERIQRSIYGFGDLKGYLEKQQEICKEKLEEGQKNVSVDYAELQRVADMYYAEKNYYKAARGYFRLIAGGQGALFGRFSASVNRVTGIMAHENKGNMNYENWIVKLSRLYSIEDCQKIAGEYEKYKTQGGLSENTLNLIEKRLTLQIWIYVVNAKQLSMEKKYKKALEKLAFAVSLMPTVKSAKKQMNFNFSNILSESIDLALFVDLEKQDLDRISLFFKDIIYEWLRDGFNKLKENEFEEARDIFKDIRESMAERDNILRTFFGILFLPYINKMEELIGILLDEKADLKKAEHRLLLEGNIPGDETITVNLFGREILTAEDRKKIFNTKSIEELKSIIENIRITTPIWKEVFGLLMLQPESYLLNDNGDFKIEEYSKLKNFMWGIGEKYPEAGPLLLGFKESIENFKDYIGAQTISKIIDFANSGGESLKPWYREVLGKNIKGIGDIKKIVYGFTACSTSWQEIFPIMIGKIQEFQKELRFSEKIDIEEIKGMEEKVRGIPEVAKINRERLILNLVALRKNIWIKNNFPPFSLESLIDILNRFPGELLRALIFAEPFTNEDLSRDSTLGFARSETGAGFAVDFYKHIKEETEVYHVEPERLQGTVWHELIHKASFSKTHDKSPAIPVKIWKDIAEKGGFVGYLNEGNEPRPFSDGSAFLGKKGRGEFVFTGDFEGDIEKLRNINYSQWIYWDKKENILVDYVPKKEFGNIGEVIEGKRYILIPDENVGGRLEEKGYKLNLIKDKIAIEVREDKGGDMHLKSSPLELVAYAGVGYIKDSDKAKRHDLYKEIIGYLEKYLFTFIDEDGKVLRYVFPSGKAGCVPVDDKEGAKPVAPYYEQRRLSVEVKPFQTVSIFKSQIPVRFADKEKAGDVTFRLGGKNGDFVGIKSVPVEGGFNYKLIFKPKDGEGQVYFLNIGETVTIGRDKENTIETKTIRVSRKHLKVEVREDKIEVIDLDSTNGTEVVKEELKGAQKAIGPRWKKKDRDAFSEYFEKFMINVFRYPNKKVRIANEEKVKNAGRLAYDRIPEIYKEYYDEEKIVPLDIDYGSKSQKIIVHIVPADTFGFPIRKGAIYAKDMVYAKGKTGYCYYDEKEDKLEWKEDGNFHIYVTEPHWENNLSKNDLLLAETIDHEWYENKIAPWKMISEELCHRKAASRSRFFVNKDKTHGLSEYNEFFIRQSIKDRVEGLKHLWAIFKEERDKPKGLFTAQELNGILEYEKKFKENVKNAISGILMILIDRAIEKMKRYKGRDGAFMDISEVERLIVVFDLHGGYETLDAILKQDDIYRDIRNGKAHLLVLGDAIHPGHRMKYETPEGQRDSLETLMNLLILIFACPNNIHYIMGDHELSHVRIFDPLKPGMSGVPVNQRKVFEDYIEKEFGKELLDKIKEFLKELPYVARVNKGIIFAHAGPPKSKISIGTIKELNNTDKYKKNFQTYSTLERLVDNVVRRTSPNISDRIIKEDENSNFLEGTESKMAIYAHNIPREDDAKKLGFYKVLEEYVFGYGNNLIIGNSQSRKHAGYMDIYFPNSNLDEGWEGSKDKNGESALKVIKLELEERIARLNEEIIVKLKGLKITNEELEGLIKYLDKTLKPGEKDTVVAVIEEMDPERGEKILNNLIGLIPEKMDVLEFIKVLQNILEEVLEEIKPTTLKAPGSDNLGLCVTGDTILPILQLEKIQCLRRCLHLSCMTKKNVQGDASDIEYKQIVDVRPGDYVLSLNESTKRIEPHRINGLLDMGIKPVYKLTTISGRSIKTTANHPYLTKNGWVKVNGLKAGDEIAVPKLVMPNSNSFGLNDKKTASQFLLTDTFKKINCPVDNFSSCHVFNVNNDHTSGILDSKADYIPEIFIKSEEDSRMFQGVIKDLFVSSVSHPSVYCPLHFEAGFNKRLYEFGINTIVSKDMHNSLFLEDNLGRFFTQKGSEFDSGDDVLFGNAGIFPWYFINCVSSANHIKNVTDGYPRSFNAGFAKPYLRVNRYSVLQRNFGHFYHLQNVLYYTYKMLSNLISPQAEAAEINPDTLWDRIVSIEYVGMEHVYDIEVEGTHNFIGNGIFAHNTYMKKDPTTLKTTGSDALSEETRDGSEKRYVMGEILGNNRSIVEDDTLSTGLLPATLRSRLKAQSLAMTFKEGEIPDLSRVKLVVVDGIGRLGFARGDTKKKAKDLIYAHGRYNEGDELNEEKDVLYIYVTKEFREILRGNLMMLAFLVDHEWQENMLGKTHAEASKKAWGFVDETGMNVFYIFFIDQLAKEGDIKYLKKLTGEHPNDPEGRFRDYVKDAIKIARIKKNKLLAWIEFGRLLKKIDMPDIYYDDEWSGYNTAPLIRMKALQLLGKIVIGRGVNNRLAQRIISKISDKLYDTNITVQKTAVRVLGKIAIAYPKLITQEVVNRLYFKLEFVDWGDLLSNALKEIDTAREVKNLVKLFPEISKKGQYVIYELLTQLHQSYASESVQAAVGNLVVLTRQDPELTKSVILELLHEVEHANPVFPYNRDAYFIKLIAPALAGILENDITMFIKDRKLIRRIIKVLSYKLSMDNSYESVPGAISNALRRINLLFRMDLSEYHKFVIERFLRDNEDGWMYLVGKLTEERPGFRGISVRRFERKLRRYVEEKIKENPCNSVLSHRESAFYKCAVGMPIKVLVNPVRGRPAEGTATTALGRSASNGVNRNMRLGIEKWINGKVEVVVSSDKGGILEKIQLKNEERLNREEYGVSILLLGDKIEISNIGKSKIYIATETPRVSEDIFGVIDPRLADKEIKNWKELISEAVEGDLIEDAVRKMRGFKGRKGSFVEVEDAKGLAVVSDLHGNYKGLINKLFQDDIWDALEKGEAHLLFLGDIIHPGSGDLESKEEQLNSIKTLVLLMKLITLFPDNVHCIIGDHELSHLISESDIYKTIMVKEDYRDVPVIQDMVFENYIRDNYSKEFMEEIKKFFRALPCVARVNGDIVLTHCGPAEYSITNEEELKRINIKDPSQIELVKDIVCRLREKVYGKEKQSRKVDVEALSWFLDLVRCRLLISGHTVPNYANAKEFGFSVLKPGCIGYVLDEQEILKQIIVNSQGSPCGYMYLDLVEFKKSFNGKIESLKDPKGGSALKSIRDGVEEVLDEIQYVVLKWGVKIERSALREVIENAEDEVSVPTFERIIALLGPEMKLEDLFKLAKEISGPLAKIGSDKGGEFIANVLEGILEKARENKVEVAKDNDVRERFFNTVRPLLVNLGVTEAEMAGELELIDMALFIIEYEPLLNMTEIHKGYFDYLEQICQSCGVDRDTLKRVFSDSCSDYQESRIFEKLGKKKEEINSRDLEKILKRKGLWEKYQWIEKLRKMIGEDFKGADIVEDKNSLFSRGARRLRLYSKIVNELKIADGDNKYRAVIDSGLADDLVGLDGVVDFKTVRVDKPQELNTYLSATSVAQEWSGYLIDKLGIDKTKGGMISIPEELFIKKIEGNKITYSPGLTAVLKEAKGLIVEIRTEDDAVKEEIERIINLFSEDIKGRIKVVKYSNEELEERLKEVKKEEGQNSVFVLSEEQKNIGSVLEDRIRSNDIKVFCTDSMAIHAVLLYGMLQAQVKEMFKDKKYWGEGIDVIRKLQLFGIKEDAINDILTKNEAFFVITTNMLLEQYKLYRATIEISA